MGSTPTPTTARNASISRPEAVRAPVEHQPVRLELLDLLAEHDLDAVLAVELCDLPGELWRGKRRYEPVAHLDDRHFEPEHAERRGDLGADEAATHDEGLACVCRLLLHAHRIGDRAEDVHGRQIGSGDGKRQRAGAGGDHEGAVANLLATFGPDGVVCGLDRLDRRAEAQFDDERVVLLGRVHERTVSLHLASEDALGQRRPVVRRLIVGGEEDDQRVALVLPIGVDQAGRGTATPDDHDRILRHPSTLPAAGAPHTSAPPFSGAGRA